MTRADVNKLVLLRAKLIDAKQRQFIAGLGGITRTLYSAILDGYIRQLQVIEGKIRDNDFNVRLSNDLDEIFQRFKATQEVPFVRSIAKSLGDIANNSDKYYSILSQDRKLMNRVQRDTRRTVLASTNTYLQRLTNDQSVANDLKRFAIGSVMSGARYKDFLTGIKNRVMGTEQSDGTLAKYYKAFAYDTFHQFDRGYSLSMANGLGMKSFIYAGGIIEDSRPFCIDKNNRVYTVEDAQEWKNDPRLPRTTQEKETGVLNYNPLIDMGRWNCRHSPNYLSESLAKKFIQDDKAQAIKNIVDGVNSGGISYDTVRRSNYGGAPAFAISPYPENSLTIDGKVSPEQIAQFIDTNRDILKKPLHMVGGWYDPASGKTYLDISVVSNNRDLAVKMGAAFDQIGIFDLTKFETINTFGTGNIILADPLTRQSYLDKLITDPRKLFGDNGESFEKQLNAIPTAEGLSEANAIIENAAKRFAVLNKEKLINTYIETFGTVASADNMRRLFAPVGYNGTNAGAVHEPASWLNKAVFDRLLQVGDNQKVLFTAGGSGAGKTSTIKNVFPELLDSRDMIFDGNFSTLGSAIKNIEKARAEGNIVDIVYIYREPVDAWDGVISRALNNKEEGGRTVPMSAFLKNHAGSWEVINNILQNKREGVNVYLIDNSLGRGNAKALTLEKFRSISYPPDLKDKLIAITKKLLDEGKITQDQYENLLQ